MQELLTSNREKIAELCRRHHVRRLCVFGSAVRDDFDSIHSDVDFLVDFTVPSQTHYAANFFALQKSLSHLLQRDVDLVTDGSIRNPYLLRNIQIDAQVLYAS